jgi:hypothetical protein
MALTYNPKAGIQSTTGGSQTVSQQKAKMFADIDPRELTPLEISLFGGIDEIKKQKEAAKQSIKSDYIAPKEEPKPAPTESAEGEREPKRLWRVMIKGGDPSKSVFAESKEEAESILKSMGGDGVVAGIRFPSKTAAEESALKEQYIQRVKSNWSVDKKEKPETRPYTKEERIARKDEGIVRKMEESGATQEQRDKYLANLERLRSEKSAREASSRERAERFNANQAAKRAGEEQVNQYNKQLSSLKKAYYDAGKSGDYVEQYKLGELINSYTAGVPNESGSRRNDIIAIRNKEFAEKIRRDREAKLAAERTRMANPDYQQFNSAY